MPPQYWLYGLAPLNLLYTLARISCWPPEDDSICDPKYVGVNFTWTFNVFLINIKLWVHELVIIGLVISMHGLNMKFEITKTWDCYLFRSQSTRCCCDMTLPHRQSKTIFEKGLSPAKYTPVLVLFKDDKKHPILVYDLVSYFPQISFERPKSTCSCSGKRARLRWSRISVLAFGTQVRVFKHGRSRRIFKGK